MPQSLPAAIDLHAGPAAPNGPRRIGADCAPCRIKCDCPACSGETVDLTEALGELVDDVANLSEADDALDVELVAAVVVATVVSSGDDLVPPFVEDIIPQLEAKSGSGALALLLSIGAVARGPREELANAANAAADRLVATGVPKPRWADDLAEPVEIGGRMRLHDRAETVSVLVASFQRAGRGHTFLVTVDHSDRGAASDIFLVDTGHLPEVLDDLRADGLAVETSPLDPAEFRWYVEDALDAHAVDEEVLWEEPSSAPFEEQGPPYEVLAALLRARLTALPPPRKPAGALAHYEAGAHPTEDELTYLTVKPPALKLPAKRNKADGPAPIYQIKVSLRNAKPPIWRRLLVPADVNLAGLHEVIQISFGWNGSHMHVFTTPYGDFGHPDKQLEHRAEKPVTLEQVAPQAKDKIRYTYDFGDDWLHEIVVEKVLDRDPALTYPRCEGGRRAAPPDDCGGIWGYDDLVEALADSRHPDHQERLEWMGLDEASDFDPAAFDPDKVNRALDKPRR